MFKENIKLHIISYLFLQEKLLFLTLRIFINFIDQYTNTKHFYLVIRESIAYSLTAYFSIEENVKI